MHVLDASQIWNIVAVYSHALSAHMSSISLQAVQFMALETAKIKNDLPRLTAALLSDYNPPKFHHKDESSIDQELLSMKVTHQVSYTKTSFYFDFVFQFSNDPKCQ